MSNEQSGGIMRQLRLLFTENCNRNCEGCCNKQYDLNALPQITAKKVSEYDMVMITGGEPLLYPDDLKSYAQYLKTHNPDILIYVYTAKVDNIDDSLQVLRNIDGFTLTLHTDKDRVAFNKFNNVLLERPELIEDKSMRLNIFKDVGTLTSDTSNWIVKDDMEWVENCPIPVNEDFKRV